MKGFIFQINTTQTSHDTTSDEESSHDEDLDDEDNIVVQEINVEDVDVDDDDEDDEEAIAPGLRNVHAAIVGSDDTLVEGHDYDVITVYTVNPDLDLLEASSDEEKDSDNANENETEAVEEDNNYKVNFVQPATDIRRRVMDMLSTPIESNVEEFLLKNGSILNTDEPVVNDVDEYFIKEKPPTPIPDVDEFFVKTKPAESIPEITPNIDEFLVKEPIKKEPLPNVDEFFVKTETVGTPEATASVSKPENNGDVSINDLEVLPNIEELKRYLLEDMSYAKFRSIQKSCSVPQSPMQSILDIDDTKTCLSFEDLNLDLSDLTFDNDKDKSDLTDKSDDMPRTLTDDDINSFLITSKTEHKESERYEDDLSHQDMEIEKPLEPKIEPAIPKVKIVTTKIEPPVILKRKPAAPVPVVTPTVLDFCIEKTKIKKEVESKIEVDDFVDVESCNDSSIPVLEANNLNSLLEQFEATEKLNTKKRTVVKAEEKPKSSKYSLTNGMRLQDAGVQLNKNKMRQILVSTFLSNYPLGTSKKCIQKLNVLQMPSTINKVIRSPSPVHSDHDYCSSKKRHSLPSVRGGQSLLKPEVLSSNSRILNSRHRSCKNKKVVYHLSSDEETEKSDNKQKKVTNQSDDVNLRKKVIKQPIKSPVQSNCRKKLSPPHVVPEESVKDKHKNTVISKKASKASDTPSSQKTNGSIKLTIKNKSEVILNCDFKDSQKDKNLEKCKSSVSDKQCNDVSKTVNIKQEKIKEVDRHENKKISNTETVTVKEESRPREEHFYTALFSNKQDVQVPQVIQVKAEKRPFDEEMTKIAEEAVKKELEQPLKKKKLNLQEYKLRRGVSSNNSSTTVSPEAIFPDMPSPSCLDKLKYAVPRTPPNTNNTNTHKTQNEAPKKIFDPIKEASRKILMNSRKHKAEAMRKRDEDIVMSKIPKVDILELKPLISEDEMLQISKMTAPEALPVPVKPQLSPNYEEIILVSVGVNTDENVFKEMDAEKRIKAEKRKSSSPPKGSKCLINFKIKKSDHVLKQNVFDSVKKDKRNLNDDCKHESKIDKDRYKDITATLKSVEKQVETKISSNSLFASIQDVVMKKAPGDVVEKPHEVRRCKSKSPQHKEQTVASVSIIRDYDPKAEHGEDKVILHLVKGRRKPKSSSSIVQTDPIPAQSESITDNTNRRRNDSDMSVSSDNSTKKKEKTDIVKSRPDRIEKKDSRRSRSKERYDAKHRRRSRSRSRRRRHRSISKSRSRSRGRYKRFRRSDSPYTAKGRSSSRRRRSPSAKKEKQLKSVSRPRSRSLTPIKRPKSSPQINNNVNEKKLNSATPPLRKSTVSESSDSSSR